VIEAIFITHLFEEALQRAPPKATILQFQALNSSLMARIAQLKLHAARSSVVSTTAHIRAIAFPIIG
jgi:glutamine synthetase adenylyltransferase